MTTVLHIVPELKPGGVEFYTLRMVDAITRAGARPLVASGPGALLADLNALGGEHIPFDAAAKNWFAWPARARALAKLIDRERVDLVHVGSRVPGWLAVLARRHRPFPLVMNYHGAYSEGFPGKRAYNAVMTKGDVCLASSRFTVEHVRARHPIDPAKLKRIWLGIDPTTFDPACINAKRANAVRAAWGVTADQRIILSAGRLVSLKGHDVVIAAADKIFAEHADAVIVIAGDDLGRADYRRRLDELIAQTTDPSRIRLVGNCTDMPAAFAVAHASVIGSVRPETFSYVAIESQAMGCPVISADAGAVSDTLATDDDAGRTGWLYPPGDASAMADRINAALRLTLQERDAIAERCRARVLDHFTLARMQRETLAEYDRLLGTGLAAAFNPDGTHHG